MSFNFVQYNEKIYVELGELNIFLKENNLPELRINKLERVGEQK